MHKYAYGRAGPLWKATHQNTKASQHQQNLEPCFHCLGQVKLRRSAHITGLAWRPPDHEHACTQIQRQRAHKYTRTHLALGSNSLSEGILVVYQERLAVSLHDGSQDAQGRLHAAAKKQAEVSAQLESKHEK